MKNKQLPYSEGTWFAVPLRDGGFGAGIVARSAGNGCLFGYFFGPRRDHVPLLAEVEGLLPADALWIGQFGDLGILNGEWRILGKSGNWDRSLWPLPQFVRVDNISGKAWKATYSDDLQLIREEPCDAALRGELPQDALWGYGAVEKRLTRLLAS